MTERRVICGDALTVLPTLSVDVIVTSLPDMAELGWTDTQQYESWFLSAALQRVGGRTLSKAGLLLSLDRRLLWHKITLRHRVDAVDLYRPAYSHLIAFSTMGRVGQAEADVIDGGKPLWPYGMGMRTALVAARYARRFGDVLCDPFCGYGTMLAAADYVGYPTAIGVDIDEACCRRSEQLRWPSTREPARP